MTKKICKKIKYAVCMLAFAAGIIIFSCAFSCRVPSDVIINGVEVGGLTRAEAVEKLRERQIEYLKSKTLEIEAEDEVYSFTYPEINFSESYGRDINTVNAGGEYAFETRYYLCGKNEVISGICAAHSREMSEPYAIFNADGAPFTYIDGVEGVKADKEKLTKDINTALKGGFGRVTVSLTRTPYTRSLADIKASTRYISGYTTYYDRENYNRSQNIALAAAAVNGTILSGGESFSFNNVVGERTKERGYLTAKIIENGEFTQGVGGGVCQVSTTLYNAALLSGMSVTEYHPHSLAVSYVPPSRDAMVSGKYFDLKFVNAQKTPVYIRAKASGGSLKISFYGVCGEREYSIETEVTKSIPPPVTYTDNPQKARAGKNGTQSQSFLVINCKDEQTRILLRKDTYLPVAGVEYVAANCLP